MKEILSGSYRVIYFTISYITIVTAGVVRDKTASGSGIINIFS